MPLGQHRPHSSFCAAGEEPRLEAGHCRTATMTGSSSSSIAGVDASPATSSSSIAGVDEAPRPAAAALPGSRQAPPGSRLVTSAPPPRSAAATAAALPDEAQQDGAGAR
ncbi:hypothetical protein PR003_g27686 [Phytophthora rubi]|uniref:Uncharacterized protein n=1 Tax=Phytophthora rubi TaxID=129364 RepID=A0A6A4BW86_9STRA|nr:hypothetical protein PR003_g27686 [Phytophthora rubi]